MCRSTFGSPSSAPASPASAWPLRYEQANAGPYLVFERGCQIGGTSKQTTTGCCCDVPSHVYSYSFDLNNRAEGNPQWEILSYIEQTARHHNVIPHIRCNHEVVQATWDEAAHRWIIDTSQGWFTADILVNAGGALSNPGAESPASRGTQERCITPHSGTTSSEPAGNGWRLSAPAPRRSSSCRRSSPTWRGRVLPPAHRAVGDPAAGTTRSPASHAPAATSTVPKPPERSMRGWILYAGAARPGVMGFRASAGDGRSADRLATLAPRAVRSADPRAARASLTPGPTSMGCKRVLISERLVPGGRRRPNVDVVSDGPGRGDRPHAVVGTDGTGGRGRRASSSAPASAATQTRRSAQAYLVGRDGQHAGRALERLSTQGATSARPWPGFPNLVMLDRAQHRPGPQLDDLHDRVPTGLRSGLPPRVMRESGATTFEVKPDAAERYYRQLQQKPARVQRWIAPGHSW